MAKQKVLALIPARGGSKGIPGKNLRRVGGITLLARTIRAARGATQVNRVAVSTDDPAIAAEARAEGADVIDRPADISGDTASSESALLHALDYLATTEGYHPELLVFLQCTSPFTQAADVDDLVGRLLDSGADTAFTASPFHGFLWREVPGGGMAGVNHDAAHRPRRQERAPEYLENGAIYVMRVAGFLKARHRFFGHTVLSVMPQARSMEIDEPDDLREAKVLAANCVITSLPSGMRALLMDFDGIHTDNHVYIDQDGRETVRCSRSDGWGVAQLRALGFPMAVLSNESNPVVQARCAKLRIECFTGLGEKSEFMRQWCERMGIAPEQVVFLGHDENDLSCLRLAGYAVVPMDAHPAARAEADLVLERAGGQGAVRDLCDALRVYLEKRSDQNAKE
jgi:N-acylneuraminate cytidylyltransferase